MKLLWRLLKCFCLLAGSPPAQGSKNCALQTCCLLLVLLNRRAPEHSRAVHWHAVFDCFCAMTKLLHSCDRAIEPSSLKYVLALHRKCLLTPVLVDFYSKPFLPWYVLFIGFFVVTCGSEASYNEWAQLLSYVLQDCIALEYLTCPQSLPRLHQLLPCPPVRHRIVSGKYGAGLLPPCPACISKLGTIAQLVNSFTQVRVKLFLLSSFICPSSALSQSTAVTHKDVSQVKHDLWVSDWRLF